MAGSTSYPKDVATPRRAWVRCLAVGIGLAVFGFVAGPSAQAQVPAVPPLPPEAEAALSKVEDLVIPVLVDAAIQGQVASNAIGFALRPGCAAAGTAVLLVVVAGGSLPVSPGFISTPLLIFCAGAFSPGPVDPVFQQVDDAAGAELAAQVKPLLKQGRDALAPVRAELGDVCGVLALAGSTPRQVPKPLSRFDFVKLLC